MDRPLYKAIFWIPRVLGILFACFLSLFALDVFDMGLSTWEAIVALLIHLIPVYVIVIVLLLAWRWELVGGIIYIVLGILYIIASRGMFFFGISGPLMLVGILFLVGWWYKRRLQSA